MYIGYIVRKVSRQPLPIASRRRRREGRAAAYATDRTPPLLALSRRKNRPPIRRRKPAPSPLVLLGARHDHAAFDKFVGIVGIVGISDGDDGSIIVIETSSLHLGRKSNDGDGGQYIQQKRSRILQ